MITTSSPFHLCQQKHPTALDRQYGLGGERGGEEWSCEWIAEMKKIPSCHPHLWFLFEHCLYSLPAFHKIFILLCSQQGNCSTLTVQPKSHKAWQLPKAFLCDPEQTNSRPLSLSVQEHGPWGEARRGHVWDKQQEMALHLMVWPLSVLSLCLRDGDQTISETPSMHSHRK